MSDDEVVIEVWDKTCTERVWITDPTLLTATPRHNQQPTAQVTVPLDHERVGALTAKGSRVVVRYRDEHLVGGPVTLRRVTGAASSRALVCEVSDDWRLFSRVLLWPVPTSPITNQAGREYHTVTGPAETVVKTLLGAAITRLGLPITVAPDLGRGATITVSARMAVPADVLLPAIDQAGIGVTVRQVIGGQVLDVYEPALWPGILSESGGTVTDLEWSDASPTATRATLGADGDGTARTFRAATNAALEAEWGDVVEVWVDARDLKHDEPGFAAAATARMQAALAAGGPTSGVKVSLAEAGRHRYGGPVGMHVGDRLRVELSPGAEPLVEVLRAATLVWSRAGARVTPVLGEPAETATSMTGRAIAAAMRQIRQMQTRR